MRKKLLAAACAVALTGLGAGSALAGEITGTGTWIAGSPDAPLNGNSECAFSGLNDDNLPTDAIAQSFGQIVKVAGPLGGVPGVACNPTRAE
jgi:hypothetical protein